MASVYICVRLERMEPWIMVNTFFETLILHIAIISLCLATMLMFKMISLSKEISALLVPLYW